MKNTFCLILMMSFILVSCASSKINERLTDLNSRAEFELDCSADKLTTQVLKEILFMGDLYPGHTIGVSACGKKAV